jgi:NAD(P)-dependent dehydrogenase (short-subunit alcohol dehydrogenase family)
VALVDYNTEWAQETKRMIDEEGGTSEVVQCDVTKEDSCKKAVQKTVELFGTVHILVNIGTPFNSVLKSLISNSG